MRNEGMDNSEKVETFVISQHIQNQVEVSGFEAVDDSVHMIEWLRKGRDFRQFVVCDIESELYAQDSGAQLLSVNCKAKPNFETKVKTDSNGRSGIVTQFSVTFPVSLRVKSANGAIWKLDVEHNYHATNLDFPDKFQLRLNFTIVGSQAES
jgi:hypothetical protein